MKFTVTSRIALIVAVGCAWWVGVAPASSVEGGKDVKGWCGDAIIRDYAIDYEAMCKRGTDLPERCFEEMAAFTTCLDPNPCPKPRVESAIHSAAQRFAACMKGE